MQAQTAVIVILLIVISILLYTFFRLKRKPLTGAITVRVLVSKKGKTYYILGIQNVDYRGRNRCVATSKIKWDNARFGDRFTMEKGDKYYRTR